MANQPMFRFGRHPGLPIVRTDKQPGDHEITHPDLRRILAERKRAA